MNIFSLHFGIKFHVVVLLLFTSLNLFSQTKYKVENAGTDDVNGTYTEFDTVCGKKAYMYNSGGTNYYIHYYHDTVSNMWHNWSIDVDTAGDVFNQLYSILSTADTPPEGTWGTNNGDSPDAEVSEIPSRLYFSNSFFYEDIALDYDDGRIDNFPPLTITLSPISDETFNGEIGEDFVNEGKLVITNMPAGLWVESQLVDSLNLNLWIWGNALNHSSADDVTNLTFVFQDAAFDGAEASDIQYSTVTDRRIIFKSKINIAPSGGDYSSINDGITNAENGDMLVLSADTFTEYVSITKDIHIAGQGPGKTVVQAHEKYDSAISRVFGSSGDFDKIILEGMTIRNGKVTDINAYGGAVFAFRNLEIINCEIVDNIAYGNNAGSECAGGGIYGHTSCNKITIYNSTISNNKVIRIDGGDTTVMGGGIFGNNIEMINSTISGNSCQGNGGGIFTKLSHTLVNSTITNNSATENGGGIYVQDMITTGDIVNITNTIIANNSASKGEDLFREDGTIHVSHSIIESSETYTGDALNGTVTELSTDDPLLDVLADNDGNTKTHALIMGSPAINNGTTDEEDVPDTDQRGFNRDNNPDIGAFEYEGAFCEDTLIEESEILCEGDSLFFNETYLKTEGVYYDSLLTVGNCDSIIKLTVSIREVFDSTIYKIICSGDSILFDGVYRKTEGSFIDSAQTVNGCDSVIILNLIENPIYNIVIYDTICEGDSLFAGGSYQFFAGVYSDTYQTINNCDSIMTTNLIIEGCSITDAIEKTIFKNIQIYPVPVKDILNIQFNNIDYIEIYNNSGEMILKTNESKVSFYELPEGLYFLNLIDKQKNIFRRKIIHIK